MDDRAATEITVERRMVRWRRICYVAPLRRSTAFVLTVVEYRRVTFAELTRRPGVDTFVFRAAQ